MKQCIKFFFKNTSSFKLHCQRFYNSSSCDQRHKLNVNPNFRYVFAFNWSVNYHNNISTLKDKKNRNVCTLTPKCCHQHVEIKQRALQKSVGLDDMRSIQLVGLQRIHQCFVINCLLNKRPRISMLIALIELCYFTFSIPTKARN